MPLPEARMEQVALGRGVADRSCLLERPLERWELRRGPKNHLGRMPCWGYILLRPHTELFLTFGKRSSSSCCRGGKGLSP